MRISIIRYSLKSTIVKMSSKDKSKTLKEKSLKQPKLTNLIRERSPASSADERPSKKIASTSCSEAEADAKPIPSTSKAAGEGSGENPLNKIMKVNLASIFNPNIKEEESAESELAKSIKEKRGRLYTDITEFRFNKKRVRVLSEAGEISKESEGILYWMSRDQRVQGMLNRHTRTCSSKT